MRKNSKNVRHYEAGLTGRSNLAARDCFASLRLSRKDGIAFLLALLAVLSFPVPARAEAEEKRMIGTVTGVLPDPKDAKLFVADRENASNTFRVGEKTPIKKQIDLAEIQSGEHAAVIFEKEASGRFIALSTSVGDAEKVEMEREELMKFAPKPDVPEAPELPEQPDMPPMPGGEPPPEGAEGQQPGGGKKEDAPGAFTKEQADAAKKGEGEKGPLDDILSQESPLGAPTAEPPGFVSGKIVSMDLKSETPVMVIAGEEGEVEVQMGPQIQIVNRYLELESILKGNQVEVLYEDGGDADKLAKSILIAREEAAQEAMAAIGEIPTLDTTVEEAPASKEKEESASEEDGGEETQ